MISSCFLISPALQHQSMSELCECLSGCSVPRNSVTLISQNFMMYLQDRVCTHLQAYIHVMSRVEGWVCPCQGHAAQDPTRVPWLLSSPVLVSMFSFYCNRFNVKHAFPNPQLHFPTLHLQPTVSGPGGF